MPASSVAEAIGVLDKYRHCTWARPVAKNKASRLKPREYEAARALLKGAISNRFIEQVDHEPTHVSLAELISPINQSYQFRRKRGKSHRVKKPMGGADCMIAGIAVLLHRRLGGSHVALATADQRLADVIGKCRRLTEKQADKFGIKSASGAGVSFFL